MRDILMFGVVLVYLFYGAPVVAPFVGAPTAYAAVFLLLITWVGARAVSMFKEDR